METVVSQGQGISVEPIKAGHARQWLQCRTCQKVSYYDFVPFSNSVPIRITPCGHSIGQRDLGCNPIAAEEAFRLLAIEQSNTQAEERRRQYEAARAKMCRPQPTYIVFNKRAYWLTDDETLVSCPMMSSGGPMFGQADVVEEAPPRSPERAIHHAAASALRLIGLTAQMDNARKEDATPAQPAS